MQEIINSVNYTSIWWAICAPIIFMVLDVISGCMIAWINSEYQSSKMRQGLGKKFAELMTIIAGFVIQQLIGISHIYVFCIVYVCIMELSSLVENAEKLGFPLPEKLKKKLNNIVDETKKGDE